MCYPVCGMVHIKETLLLIDKSSLCGGSGFPFSLSEWSLTICLTPYNHNLTQQYAIWWNTTCIYYITSTFDPTITLLPPIFVGIMDSPESDKKDVRRPMNAFLIFCKRHRAIVREKHPDLDNRSITKILGDLWANLADGDKSVYTKLAKQVSNK